MYIINTLYSRENGGSTEPPRTPPLRTPLQSSLKIDGMTGLQGCFPGCPYVAMPLWRNTVIFPSCKSRTCSKTSVLYTVVFSCSTYRLYSMFSICYKAISLGHSKRVCCALKTTSATTYFWRRVDRIPTMAALYSKIDHFNPDQEEWPQYVERLEQFFEANEIKGEAMATKRRAIFHRTSALPVTAKPHGADEASRKDIPRVGGQVN